HGHIDQVPTRYTCFTSRRHSSRLRSTIGGCVELIAIKEPIYSFPTGGDAPIASPEQAFLDYLYRCRLVDVRAQGLVFRRLHELRPDILNQLGSRYPRTVRIAAEKMLASHGGASSAGSPSASSCTRHSDGATAR
ncbi:MAG: hypothetical protein MUF51_11400, partial [Vicinamibacteria bacterium]|nr:hypothetical protein [Vicinamibacteria bacterium]